MREEGGGARLDIVFSRRCARQTPLTAWQNDAPILKTVRIILFLSETGTSRGEHPEAVCPWDSVGPVAVPISAELVGWFVRFGCAAAVARALSASSDSSFGAHRAGFLWGGGVSTGPLAMAGSDTAVEPAVTQHLRLHGLACGGGQLELEGVDWSR